MQDLPEDVQAMLREFKNSVFYPAYREYVLTEAGKCLGQLRMNKDHEVDLYTKGMMYGIEKLVLDLNADQVENGHVEKANTENREYTKELLDKKFNM